MLEQKITEQDETIRSMQRSMELATAEHGTWLHTTNKQLRQHCVDKRDAEVKVIKARDDLACVKQKTASRIRNLERDVKNKAKETMDMQTSLEGRVASIEEVERDMTKQRRILAAKQDDLKKQQAVSELQMASLAFQRANNKTDRKKQKTAHGKALLVERQTRVRDNMVREHTVSL